MAGRVLIIDDDPINVKILGDFLTRKGLTVERAPDGEQGLAHLEASPPDLVLLDVLLPKINGLDLCRRIKQSPSAPPVFLMSAVYRSPSIQRDAREQYGADAYFVKPFRVQELWQAVERALPGRAPAQGAPLEGELSAVGFARLLVTLAATEENGALHLAHGNSEKRIYLERGLLVAVESTLRSERFEQFLLDHAVSKQDLQDLSLFAEWARRHTEERLLSCFLMRQGTFRFEPGRTVPTGLPRTELQVPRLVLEGVRRHMPLFELSHEIELVRRRIVHATPEAPQVLLGVPLSADASSVLGAIDGFATVEEVIARAGVQTAAAMQILFGFILLDVVAVEEAARQNTT